MCDFSMHELLKIFVLVLELVLIHFQHKKIQGLISSAKNSNQRLESLEQSEKQKCLND